MDVSLERPIETGSFAPWSLSLWPPDSIRVVDWNIDRGLQLSAAIDFLGDMKADLAILQECDLNAKRTHHVNVAREIAKKLRMNYVFGCEFQELSQGSRSSPAYHGQATLSPWPVASPRILRFRRQSNFWQPRWFIPDIEPFQERIGGRMALITELNLAGRHLVVYNLHLESRGDDGMRCSQLDECLSDSNRFKPSLPIVLAGDFNFDVSRTSICQGLSAADFRNAFSNQHSLTTPPKSLFDRGKAIDWVLVRGPIQATRPQVHSSAPGSDHYPISLTVAFV